MNSENSKKKIIIIGGGISGLSAGVFGQKNGFLTEIFEKNPVPGGLCATWKRQGYLIDGCIHWLTGTKKNVTLRKLWDEVGAFNDEDIIRNESFASYDYNGKVFTFWNDINRLEKEMLEFSPEDAKLTKKTIKYLKDLMKIEVPVQSPVYLMSIKEFLGVGLNVLPRLKSYLICNKTQLADYAQRFKSPILKFAFSNVVYGEINLYSALYAYGTNIFGNGGVLKGGSSVLVNNILKTYKDVGGNIQLNSSVRKIIIENNKAIGVELSNGEKHFADYVICAIDPFNVLKMLPSGFDVPQITKRDNNKNFPFPSCVLISFIVDKDEKDKLNLDFMHGFNTEEFVVGCSKINSIKIHDYSYDEVFIKNNKTVCNVLIPQHDKDFKYWNSFNSKEEYTAAKNKIAEIVKTKIIEHFPSLNGKIEIIDVCTQKTFERYTNAYKGGYQSYCLTAKGKMLTPNGKIKGISNLALASQWMLTPGGLPPAMLTGKFAIQQILKKEHKNYRITKKGKNDRLC